MIIDGDGHFFESEEMFEKYMEPALRNYRPRLLKDDQGHNFWVVDGQTPYKRPSIKGAGAPGTAAPPGQALQSARRASPGSQTLTNLKERLEDLDKEGIDLQFIYPSFLLHVNAWPDGVLAMGVCRAYNTWLAEACSRAPDRLKAVGVVSLQDAQGAATELGRLRELGVNAVMINGTVGAKRLDGAHKALVLLARHGFVGPSRREVRPRPREAKARGVVDDPGQRSRRGHGIHLRHAQGRVQALIITKNESAILLKRPAE